jgi:hypothetical protein
MYEFRLVLILNNERFSEHKRVTKLTHNGKIRVSSVPCVSPLELLIRFLLNFILEEGASTLEFVCKNSVS